MPGPRNRREPVDEPPVLSEEADLLIEAISLLGQRQQDTEAWLAERDRLADERLHEVEQRQADVEQRLEMLERRVAQLADEHGDLELPAGGPEDRLERLRQQVEELRSGTQAADEVDFDAAPAVNELPAPEPPTAAPAPTVSAPRSAAPPPTPATGTAVAEPRPDLWQRIERIPRNRLDAVLLILGVVVVIYAGLWQIALALGFA